VSYLEGSKGLSPDGQVGNQVKRYFLVIKNERGRVESNEIRVKLGDKYKAKERGYYIRVFSYLINFILVGVVVM
jgi:hypothetical protein